MSSEILAGDQSPAKPVPWRVVSSFGTAAGLAGRTNSEIELARKLDHARREGFTEGVSAGRQQAEEQIRPAMEGLAQVLAELAGLRDVIRRQSSEELVHLATTIAARVIHREVMVDPDALAGLVNAAFAKLQAREITRVHLHPGLERLVKNTLDQAGSPSMVVVADPALKA